MVHKVTCALDCGIVVNRSGVEAQAQGGIIDGLGTVGVLLLCNFGGRRSMRIGGVHVGRHLEHVAAQAVAQGHTC